MNSEELEVSLRAEFGDYLKHVFAEMRQKISQLHEKVEAEIENHKKQLDGVFKEILDHAGTEYNFDDGFKESVVEHLRLARDEGARITATALAEAEELEKQQTTATAGIKELHAAVTAIGDKTSQAEILKSLVQHALQFAARGAFFVIKNEHFVGWKTFGGEEEGSDEAVREIFLPVSSDTILSEAVRSLVTVESNAETFAADAEFLDKLGFGSPNKLFAIPLIARGRGVAVLYTDYVAHGSEVNIEALETMVHVAGLTVEVLASSRGGSAPGKKSVPARSADDAPAENAQENIRETVESDEVYSAVEQTAENYSAEKNGDWNQPAENFTSIEENPTDSEQYSFEQNSFETPPPSPIAWNESAETSAPVNSAHEDAPNFADEDDSPPNFSSESAAESALQSYEDFSANPTGDYRSELPKSENFEAFPPQIETYAPVVAEANQFENEIAKSAESFAAPPAVAATAPVKSRFSERNIDLPIEVSEDERRLHNDARRFARLLVSEIKLYNEQKVKEGRDASDLYERLREAIDRSREMYDKRVQPPVAAKFDYFHYELVNTLAEGDSDKLGESYPGATV